MCASKKNKIYLNLQGTPFSQIFGWGGQFTVLQASQSNAMHPEDYKYFNIVYGTVIDGSLHFMDTFQNVTRL